MTENRTFVPPEPSAQPPRWGARHIPLWVQIAMVVSAIVVGILVIWLDR